jgi:hypothetical protein
VTTPHQGVPPIPNFSLNITSTQVTAKPRALKSQWSQAAAQDLRDLWGEPVPSRPDNALDLLNDALSDPDYDPLHPETYKGRYRWSDGRIATPEEVKKALSGSTAGLVATMADEMKAEIDQEIMLSLAAMKNQP